MPQATDEDRDLMARYFGGDGINDGPPTRHLLDRGYTEDVGYWSKPSPEFIPSQMDWDCLNFLCDEWDYAYNFKGQKNHE